jgi:hypothetical protein
MPTTDLPEKLLRELADGLLIAYRVKEHKLDYSLMNRPEPTLSGVDDHALATAIIIAGREFEQVVDENIMKSERVARDDGREVTYNEAIDINWEDRIIRTSRRKEMTMDALAGVVTDLMQKAARPTPGSLQTTVSKAN